MYDYILKKVLILSLILPTLLSGKELEFNCDFFLGGYNDIQFEKPVNNLKIFNIPFLISNETGLEILDFNLSSNFIINLNKISKNISKNDELGLLLLELNNNFKDINISDLNKALKNWLVPQLQSYSDIYLQDNFIVVSTTLQNGVVLVIDGNLPKINNSDFKDRDTILFFIKLSNSNIIFDSECR